MDNKTVNTTTHLSDFESPPIQRLRDDLALALRAAALHGLSEGVCNHFSIELPDHSKIGRASCRERV